MTPVDPFFDLSDDSEWNACIGRQGTRENYVDGYIEAAIELASAVVDKGLHGQRDTLAMPILYNARHGLELALKLAVDRLHAMGAMPEAHPKDHNIRSHWELLDKAQVGDVAVRKLVADLEPYVDSLAKIDDDGQALRYAETLDGGRSLEDKALVNIALVRRSVVRLGEIMEALKYRVMELADERATGTFTPECSRRDLIAIADMLPPIARWRDAAFDEARAKIMDQFGLGSRRFSAAVEKIKTCRETRRRIGQPTDLAHLTDEHLIYAIEQWALSHPIDTDEDGTGVGRFEQRDIDRMLARLALAKQAITTIMDQLSVDEVADLDAIFQIGRGRVFCEHYEDICQEARDKIIATDDLQAEVLYLVQKTSLQSSVVTGLTILGRPDLAEQVEAIARPKASGEGTGHEPPR